MSPSTQSASVQLFQFTVPGMPELTLALALPEVLEIASLSQVVPVPFAPPFVLGVHEWRDGIITVIDLAAALQPGTAPPNEPGDDLDAHYLVAQVVSDTQRELVAWPVLPGASAISAPSQVPQAEMPAQLPAGGVRASISLADQTVVLIDLPGIFSATTIAA